jgi:hypothetical protein
MIGSSSGETRWCLCAAPVQSFEGLKSRPDPDVLAQQIVEDLEAAVEQSTKSRVI